jgi:hypothetical protein
VTDLEYKIIKKYRFYFEINTESQELRSYLKSTLSILYPTRSHREKWATQPLYAGGEPLGGKNPALWG